MLNAIQLNNINTMPCDWSNNVMYNQHNHFVLKLIELVSWNKALQLN